MYFEQKIPWLLPSSGGQNKAGQHHLLSTCVYHTTGNRSLKLDVAMQLNFCSNRTAAQGKKWMWQRTFIKGDRHLICRVSSFCQSTFFLEKEIRKY